MKNGKIFTGGKIITMSDDNPFTEAVYVQDGMIVETGKRDDIITAHQDAHIEDLKGNVMLPGFIEPHAHFDLASMISAMTIVSGIRYPDSSDVIDRIRKAADETPEGKWILCFGLDHLINRDLPKIDRYWLDDITDRHPAAVIIQSMHTIYMNSAALEKIGIDRDTEDTRDGHCIKDSSGEPCGVLTEQGFIIPVVREWLRGLEKEPMQLLREEAARWAAKGITCTWTAGYFPLYDDHIGLMREFFDSEDCPLRGDFSISFNSIEKGITDPVEIAASDNARSRMTGVKCWYDGSPYTGNMFMYDNYLENSIMQDRLYIPEGQCGERLFPEDVFYDILKNYHESGYQISVHAQGNRACHEVLGIFRDVIGSSKKKEHRHRMEHCVFIDKEDLELCAELGISLSFHTDHLYYYGEALSDIVLGRKLTSGMLPCRSALDKGIRISFHSDAPMYDPEPLRVAGNAVSRRSRAGSVIGEDEAVTVTEALRGITIDAAWQIMREKEIGSIVPGKYADFTVIAEDPYSTAAENIGDIEVLATYIDGVKTEW